jgi:arsenite-transporting ATPase
MPRLIIYTGKGGVGKSTVAAATAVLAARRGLRTLVMSVDSAHNLAEMFATRIGGEPIELAERLDALEVDVNREISAHWSSVIDFFRNLTVSSSLADQVVAEECAILPGMEEVFGLSRLRQLSASGKYDVIIVDCPPTGDMMKILRMPDVLDWFMRKYYPIEKRIAQTVWPIVGRVSGIPVPDAGYYANVEDMYEQVRNVSGLLADHQQSSLRLVMTPESVGLAETRRALSTACLFGFNVDAIMVNKLLPPAAGEGFWVDWAKSQAETLAEAKSTFEPVPCFTAEWQTQEPLGLEKLEHFGRQLFGDADPTRVYLDRPALELRTDSGHLEIRMQLPFLSKDAFQLHIKDDTLLVNLHTTRRQVPLPRAFHGKAMKRARYEDGVLIVEFE